MIPCWTHTRLSHVSSSCETELGFIEWAQYFISALGEPKVCVIVINHGWREGVSFPGEVFTAHSIVAFFKHSI